MDAELTFEQLYADLVAAQAETLPDEYFTLEQFRDDAGFTAWVARDRLDKLVVNGKLKTKQATIDGTKMSIWWFVDTNSL